MTARQQWTIVAIVVALMGSGLAAASHFLRDELQQVTVGSDAPQFSAVTLDATPLRKTLDTYKGEVVLLNVWTTTCAPCRVEMPSMDSLYKDYKPKGLKVVAVSVDPPNHEQDVRNFVKELNLSFEILYDAPGTIQQQYRTTGWPESFVISRDGTIYKKWIGENNWNSADSRRLFDQLLAAPQ